MLQVKVCGITDPGNLIQIARAKPDFAGFVFVPSSPRKADVSILDIPLPITTQRVGVFVNPSLDELAFFRRKLDVIQLHGSETPAFTNKVRSMGFRVIKAISIAHEIPVAQMRLYEDAVNFLLLDSAGPQAGGNGIAFDWALLENYSMDIPFFLSGGISPQDCATIQTLNNAQLIGVDINSRFECSPGMKDPLRVKSFIKSIRGQS